MRFTSCMVLSRRFPHFIRKTHANWRIDDVMGDAKQYNTINVLVPSLQNMADCALQCNVTILGVT